MQTYADIPSTTKIKIARGHWNDRTDSLRSNFSGSSAPGVAVVGQLFFNTTGPVLNVCTNATGPVFSEFFATLMPNNVVSYAKMQDISTTQRLVGRNSGGAGDPEEVTASQVLDWLGNTRGQVLYRGASGWSVLSPGTSGQFLQTNGAGADPTWGAPSSGSLFDGDKGDITVSASATVFTIDANAVTLPKIAQIPTARILGRVTAGTGNVEELTAANVASIIQGATFSWSAAHEFTLASNHGPRFNDAFWAWRNAAGTREGYIQHLLAGLFLMRNEVSGQAIDLQTTGGGDVQANGLHIYTTNDASSTNIVNKLVIRDANGDFAGRYINSTYFNSTDDVNTGAVTYLIGKFGDNYHRSVDATRLRNFASINLVENKSSATIRSELTKSNVDTALGKNAARVNLGTAANSGLISWGTGAPGTLDEGQIYLRHA